MTTTLHVHHPERWWFAARDDLPWLTDPHQDDNNERHPDREQRDWAAIVRVVEAVARAIADGDHDVDGDDPTWAVVPADLVALGPEDRQIVTSWFSVYGAPRADPWDDSLDDGRHRLWSAWRAVPAAVLPICSDLLPYLDDASDEIISTVSQSAIDGLRRLWIAPASRSPRYVDALRRAAREQGHVVDGLPRMSVEPSRNSWWSRLSGR